MALRGEASFRKAGFRLWPSGGGFESWRRDVPDTESILGGPVYIEITSDEDPGAPWDGTGIVVKAWKERVEWPMLEFNAETVAHALRLTRDIEGSIPRDYMEV